MSNLLGEPRPGRGGEHLDVVDVDRQLPVGKQFAAGQIGCHLFLGRAQAALALVPNQNTETFFKTAVGYTPVRKKASCSRSDGLLYKIMSIKTYEKDEAHALEILRKFDRVLRGLE